MSNVQRSIPQKEDILAALTGRHAEFYSLHTPLKMVSGEWRGPCPLHRGTGPNFVVNPDDGLWFCHSQCQQGGDIFSFVQKHLQMDFPTALAHVAEWAGVRSSMLRLAPAPSIATPKFVDPCHAVRAHAELMACDTTRLWLSEHRGLTTETLTRFQIGLLPSDKPGSPPRIAFPVYDALGKLTNIRKHLFAMQEGLDRSSKTLPWDKGLRSDLYPLSARKAGADVLLVEGEADALLACQMGFNALSGTLGAGNWKPEWTETLRAHSVTILYDNDQAGQEGAQKAARSLSGAECLVCLAALPAGKGKDFTEWIVLHGGTVEDVQGAIDAAVLYTSPEFPEAYLVSDNWPVAAPELFHGLAGEIVHVIEPHTEADPVALLVQLLAAFGSAIGRSAHFTAEADKHFGNLFVVLVGISSKGRKGTSWGHIRRLFAHADQHWESFCLQSGLSSGEGLIWSVRDAVEKPIKDKKTGQTVLEEIDPGVTDKRLLVQESEYASVLRVAGRDGNTLSALLRDAWDKGRLQTMTKNSAARATGAHVSLIGHVTADELRRELSSTEAANGFANRFLWVCAKRSKELPEGGSLQAEELQPLIGRLAVAIESAKQTGELRRDDAARALWRGVYHDLSEGEPGLAGAVTSRSEAQTMRLALLYALLDGADCIRHEHLTAALALWEYVESSARHVFGDSLGDPIADDILRALRSSPNGLNRTDIRELFQRHQSSDRVGQALALLVKHRRARVIMQTGTGGRPAEWWQAVGQGVQITAADR